MLLFDAPNREVCTIQLAHQHAVAGIVATERSDLVEAARRLGGRMLEDADSSMEARLTHGFLGRFRKAHLDRTGGIARWAEGDLAYFTANPEASKNCWLGRIGAPDDRLGSARRSRWRRMCY